MTKELFDAFTPTDREREEIKAYYKKYHRAGIAPLPREVYDLFKRTGSRLEFEDLYFDRRRRLCSTFMMYKAYGEEYLPELCALITAICDEESWALPAHTAASDDIRHEIDLFAAETAMTLTEMAYFLGTSLPQDVARRIAGETDERVISVFLSRRFGWEDAADNWSAVCAGCIGIVFLYTDRAVPERVMAAMRTYLCGIAPDGACMEGLGYYGYGFGYYIYFAALLKEFTGEDILSYEKVRKLTRFYGNMYLGRCAPSYSDIGADARPLSGLLNMLPSLFGDIPVPAAEPVRNDECGRWAHYIRSFLYPAPLKRQVTGETVYELSQLYVYHGERFSVFVKGGGNDEPHNHNDIGSFIISDNRRQLLCDIGCGEYTADYFNDDTRYDILCCSSAGHSVPMIDGITQQNGSRYRCTEFTAGGGHARLEIGGAYPMEVSITREFEITADGVTLRDSFIFPDGAPHKTEERLISDIKPRVADGRTYIDKLCIDRAARVTSAVIKDHSGADRTVYLMGFDAAEDFVLHITFDKAIAKFAN